MKIICQKFDYGKNGDDIHTVRYCHDQLRKELPDDYIVLSVPTDIVSLNPDDVILKVQYGEYSVEEILDIIEKAELYDKLTK